MVCKVLFFGKMVVGFKLGLFTKYLEIDLELELLSVKLSFHFLLGYSKECFLY